MMMRTARVVVTVIAIACFAFAAAGIAFAQQAGFSLAPRQSVNVGPYAVTYMGLNASGWPMYALDARGGMLAALPANPLPPACCDYQYQNVSIITTTIAPGGGTVTGVITVR
jgi:hypothetical protein